MFRTQPLLLFVFLAATTASGLQAQSLAEAAQKEAARRKEVKGTARVITNKDLPNVPPATAAVTSQPAAGSAPAPVDPDATAVAVPADSKDGQPTKDQVSGGKRDERYWRERLTKAKADVEHDQIYVEALQSRINALTTDFVNRDDPAQRAVIATDRDKAIGELDRLKKNIIDKTRTVADIEEEARRAGVPPGWLR